MNKLRPAGRNSAGKRRVEVVSPARPWPVVTRRAAVFARAIRQRYGGRTDSWPASSLVFRRLQSGGASYHLHAPFHFQMVSRLSLSWWNQAARAVPGSVPSGGMVRAPVGEADLVHRQQEVLLQRLIARETRVESVMVAGATATPARSVRASEPTAARTVRRLAAEAIPVSPTQPVPRVFRRSTAEPASASFSSASPPGHAVVQPSLARATPAPLATGLAAGDVSRVTDQVLQLLDRRMTAHHERLGRR